MLKANINAELPCGILIKNVATKVGKVADVITDGRTDFESIGKEIDKLTRNVNIPFGYMGDDDDEWLWSY